jgi:hypothetical protein
VAYFTTAKMVLNVVHYTEPWKEASCVVRMTLFKAYFFLSTLIFHSTQYQPMSKSTEHMMLMLFFAINIPVNGMATCCGGNIGKCNGEGSMSIEIHTERNFQVVI